MILVTQKAGPQPLDDLHVHSAVHVKLLPRDIASLRAGDKRHRMGNVLWLAQMAQWNLGQQRFCCSSGKLAVMSVSIKPGATQLTVMLRLPSSRANARVMPATPALAAA